MLIRTSLKMKLVSFVVMATVVLSVFNFAGSPTVVHAAGTAPALSAVDPVAISNGNKTVTLTFDQPIALSADAPSVPVLIKRSGMGSFVQSDFSGVSVTGAVYTKLQISFSTPLTGTNNQIRVQAGVVVNADASQANAAITIGNIPLGDVTPPEYLSQAISSDGNKVTLTFDEPIINNPDQPLDAQLYYKDALLDLAAANPIVVNGNTIVITLAAAFSEGSYDLYLSNVQDQSGNYSINDDERLHIEIYNYLYAPKLTVDEPKTYALPIGHVIVLQFDQNMANNLNSDVALKTAITISNDDGIHYSPLGISDRVIIDNNNDSSYLYLYLLPAKQRSGTYKVKIAAGALKNLSGVATTSDIITPPFTLETYVAPMLLDATAVNTSDNGITVTTVTLNFSKVIHDVTGGSLKDWIMLNRSTSNPRYDLLGDSDTVEFDTTGQKLIITLHNPLEGNQNQIFIYAGALQDQNYSTLPSILTRYLSIAPTDDTAPPQLKSYAIDNQNHDITFVFDENIINATTHATTLKAAVNIVSGFNIEPDNAHPFAALGTNDTVTISGNKLVIHSASALTELSNYVRIAANTLKDESGNVVANDIITEEIQPKDLLAPNLTDFDLKPMLIGSKNVNVLSMLFDKDLTDNTIDARGVSHLKEKVSYSINQGITYLPLSPDDSVVAAGGNIIGVLIHTPLSGRVIFKLDAGAVKDDNGNVLNSPVTLEIALAPVVILSTNLYSNVPSELKFVDNPDWANNIQKIEVAQWIKNPGDEYPIVTTLTEADYTVTSGKITIKKGIFENNNNYRINVVSFPYANQYFASKAVVSTEAYYSTPIAVERTNGITARVSILNTGTDDKSATLIFQLKKGDSSVSIVPMSASNLISGMYTVNFNVPDPGNPDYKVYVYVVSEYSNDPANVGINLSTEKTQWEFDYYWGMNQ
ncbi:hypothetical protein [Cohnella sp. WQ 127256]|uniref:hemoblobin-interacting domain-containing protein n=1 Tax=Cohnella sp. WQ 127256 TaxID=2938790 RepID=UPI0021193F57|nr:hypothetical protein [Cohnella sp. WQ 127256]